MGERWTEARRLLTVPSWSQPCSSTFRFLGTPLTRTVKPPVCPGCLEWGIRFLQPVVPAPNTTRTGEVRSLSESSPAPGGGAGSEAGRCPGRATSASQGAPPLPPGLALRWPRPRPPGQPGGPAPSPPSLPPPPTGVRPATRPQDACPWPFCPSAPPSTAPPTPGHLGTWLLPRLPPGTRAAPAVGRLAPGVGVGLRDDPRWGVNCFRGQRYSAHNQPEAWFGKIRNPPSRKARFT